MKYRLGMRTFNNPDIATRAVTLEVTWQQIHPEKDALLATLWMTERMLMCG